MRLNKNMYILVILLIICISLVAVFGVNAGSVQIKGMKDIRFGIDIRGGVEAVFEPADLNRVPTASELESAKIIMETRMDAQNILDREITVDNNNGQIIVRFPWKSGETNFNPQAAIAELGETARLTFRDPDGNILVEGKDVKESVVQLDKKTGKPVVTLVFNNEGAKQFADATERLVGQRISIYMDETLISAPNVREKISGGNSVISDIGSVEEAKDLSDKINSGALPFSLVSKNHSTITPTLGSGALDVMIKAGMLAFAFVCLFMIFYYRILGFVACLAIILQVSIQMLALSIPQVTLTLTGIAGIILSIGMGVDANVIIAERIREELRAGRSLGYCIDTGYKKAFSAVFDGNITTIAAAIIMMIFGTGSMLSFGYTLMVGCILNFVSGVTASQIISKSMSMNDAFAKKSLYGVKVKEAK
ncbi:Protein translocase subunit SecDF [bioreactor metagenome]|jgi:protein-export SecD/SecF family membrane protein|uniref:Protein translocase subunit SecD n=2 Tax=root TaxID=1 RepID=A0A562JKH4_9FIRM|nr:MULTISPECIES: protein translocase subunit SecD [Sedimentibacter]MEA5095556.1 protein translocase subunit SecD [Sedimentibacter saalensis]TWH83711.1 preprotein translocase subunit SecD/SecD/SecF fusion protein [Sedimentibacter saalensis]